MCLCALFLLQVCGIVKSWNPVTNPIGGTPTGFGFCDFESAEGSLCAWWLLNKLRIDGQELLVCTGLHVIYACNIHR